MKINLLRLTVMLFMLISGTGSAQFTPQDAADATAKYWLYRWRLVNDFIKIGDGQGESLPIGVRNIYGRSENYAKWGDGTQKLGMYLCLLATEFKLLYENDRFVDIEKTKTELYYALKALERLDCKAETYYIPSLPESCNGFFFRDDVPADFLDRSAKPWDPTNTLTNKDMLNQDYTKFCYQNRAQQNNTTIDNLSNRSLSDPENYLNASDFINMAQYDSDQLINENDNDMSKDQAICLFQGLGLVRLLIENVNYDVRLNDGTVISFNFNEEARVLFDRILLYIKRATTSGEVTQGIDWSIQNPFDVNVHRGYSAIAYAFPMAQAANIALGPNYPAALISPYFHIPIGYHDIYSCSTTSYNIIWNPLRFDLVNNPNMGTNNRSMEVALAAMSNSWRKGPVYLSFINITPHAIKANCDEYSWQQFYVPFWSLWNNLPIPAGQGFRDDIFNEMFDDVKRASCTGPYRFGSTGSQDHEWTNEYATIFRYFRGYDESHLGTGEIDYGFFNGLDYLILHNLMYLTAPIQLPFYEDLIDRNINYQLYSGHVGSGNYGNTIASEMNINAFHSITASELINVNSFIDQINFRAGYVQHFLPGFHATSGTNFHAWLEPFECVNGEYRLETDSTSADEPAARAYGFNEVFRFKNHSIIDYSEDAISEEIEKIDPPMSETELLLVYPNPNNGVFNFTLTGIEKEENRRVEIFNIMGELVYNKSINENYPVEMENVTSGIYIVKVTCGKEVYSAKILIE